jgi:hypothetical protein
MNMEYMKLDVTERETLLAALADMPSFLSRAFAGLTPEEARREGPDGMPSPVEQVWHLADLEHEAYETRIARLLAEHEPQLPDFDGHRVAEERDYRARPLAPALAAFAEARARNLARFRQLDADQWLRSGTQEGVGAVSLCDIPAFMSQHDASHRREIEEWLRTAPKRQP